MPFPFPADVPAPLADSIRAEAEALDALRKKVLADHADLTLTGLYNVLEALRAGRALSDKERDVHDRGLVTLIRQHHDAIDALVARAYGWDDWQILPGTGRGTAPRSGVVEGAPQAGESVSSPALAPLATPPPPAVGVRSPSPFREGLSDAVILERLVALNKARAEEEARGLVRWLRPDFQAPGAAAAPVLGDLDLGEAAAPATATILPWPKSLPEQVSAVAAVLGGAAAPMSPREVAAAFRGKRAASVEPVLGALAAIGRARKLANGRYAA